MKARMFERSEIALMGHAFRQRWPISPGMRAKAVARLAAIIESSDSERSVIAAARALAAADAVNAGQERAMLEHVSRLPSDFDSGSRIDDDPETARLESALLARLAPSEAIQATNAIAGRGPNGAGKDPGALVARPVVS